MTVDKCLETVIYYIPATIALLRVFQPLATIGARLSIFTCSSRVAFNIESQSLLLAKTLLCRAAGIFPTFCPSPAKNAARSLRLARHHCPPPPPHAEEVVSTWQTTLATGRPRAGSVRHLSTHRCRWQREREYAAVFTHPHYHHHRVRLATEPQAGSCDVKAASRPLTLLSAHSRG